MLVAAAALIALPTGVAAQEADWRASFTAGEQARAAGDSVAYAKAMAEAVSGMPAGHLNRPFTQYHAARAHAQLGDTAAAARFLRMAWDEGIESLMISFADHDPAFDRVRSAAGYIEVMGRAASMSLESSLLSGSVHLLKGAGSNLLASVGPDGVLLVDTGYRPAFAALRAALAGLGAGAVDVLVLTHPHEDHWGSVEDLADEARVHAHPATVAAMGEPYAFMEGVSVPPKAQAARDAVVADARAAFAFNGEEVRLVPMEAHTAGDVAVVFPRSRVVHLGDVWLAGNPMMFPGATEPDGFLERLDALLDGLPEGTVVVGGHDAPTDVDAVRAQVAETRACMTLVRGALAEGLSADEAVARAEGRFAAPWIRYFHRTLGGAG